MKVLLIVMISMIGCKSEQKSPYREVRMIDGSEFYYEYRSSSAPGQSGHWELRKIPKITTK